MGIKLIIAGGGTGGHIFPAIAVANAIMEQQPSAQILFIGAKGKMEMEKVPQAGYAIEGIEIAGLNRKSIFKNLTLPFKLIKSFFQVRKIVNAFKPDAAFGVGGYSSYPVLKYVQSRGIPTFLHESNAFAGKANTWLGKKATRIFVATQGMEKFFPKDKIEITGNPIRKELETLTRDASEARASFGLNPDKLTVFAMGGSLGAKTINEAILKGIGLIEGEGAQLLWQTGKLFSEQSAAASIGRPGIKAMPFVQKMDAAYAAADIVVSRAGAMSVAELSVAAKATIFVPYPFAAEDHQTENAKVLVNDNAALMVKDSDAAAQLMGKVEELISNPELRHTLAVNIGKHGIKNAANRIAEKILKLVN